jgi:hypothetical protein
LVSKLKTQQWTFLHVPLCGTRRVKKWLNFWNHFLGTFVIVHFELLFWIKDKYSSHMHF